MVVVAFVMYVVCCDLLLVCVTCLCFLWFVICCCVSVVACVRDLLGVCLWPLCGNRCVLFCCGCLELSCCLFLMMVVGLWLLVVGFGMLVIVVACF